MHRGHALTPCAGIEDGKREFVTAALMQVILKSSTSISCAGMKSDPKVPKDGVLDASNAQIRHFFLHLAHLSSSQTTPHFLLLLASASCSRRWNRDSLAEPRKATVPSHPRQSTCTSPQPHLNNSPQLSRDTPSQLVLGRTSWLRTTTKRGGDRGRHPTLYLSRFHAVVILRGRTDANLIVTKNATSRTCHFAAKL